MLRIIKAGLQVLLLTIVLLSCAVFADSETESVTADGEMQVTEEAAAEETPENKLLAQIKLCDVQRYRLLFKLVEFQYVGYQRIEPFCGIVYGAYVLLPLCVRQIIPFQQL